MYCDNTSASALAYNPVHHDRTKHIDIRHHRIREFILDGTVEIIHIKGSENPADIFTKSVTTSVFKHLICYVYGKFFWSFVSLVKFSTYGGELFLLYFSLSLSLSIIAQVLNKTHVSLSSINQW